MGSRHPSRLPVLLARKQSPTLASRLKLADICDVEIRAPHSEYADRVQEIHIKIIHSLIHYIEENI